MRFSKIILLILNIQVNFSSLDNFSQEDKYFYIDKFYQANLLFRRIKNRDVFYYLYRLRDIRIKHRFSTGSGYEGGDVSEGIIGYYQEVQPLLDEFVEWGNKNPEKMAQFIEKRYSE